MVEEYEDGGMPWLGEQDCEASATTLRRLIGVGTGPLPHVLEVLERARKNIPEAEDLAVLPRPDELMGRAHAYAKSAEREIVARQSIVEGAIDDEPLSRYVLVHELQHIIFHKGARRFRVAGGNEKIKFIAYQTSAEWQADYLARAMFMPQEMVKEVLSAAALATLARVPLVEALARFRDVRGHHISVFNPDTLPAISSRHAPTCDFDALKLRLWNALPTIPGEDPSKSRLSGIFHVRWSEYGRTSQCGWNLEQGKIIAFFSRR